VASNAARHISSTQQSTPTCAIHHATVRWDRVACQVALLAWYPVIAYGCVRASAHVVQRRATLWPEITRRMRLAAATAAPAAAATNMQSGQPASRQRQGAWTRRLLAGCCRADPAPGRTTPAPGMGQWLSSFWDAGPIPTPDPAQDAAYQCPLGAPHDSSVRCFFDITIGGQTIGRITIELRNDATPKTAEVWGQSSYPRRACCFILPTAGRLVKNVTPRAQNFRAL
jgi:hypothetical protein